ncbi:hypothetical protein HN935_01235 [archaeon]|jgi:hypothetical protein|nr:hypothetical protein [archaeon]
MSIPHVTLSTKDLRPGTILHDVADSMPIKILEANFTGSSDEHYVKYRLPGPKRSEITTRGALKIHDTFLTRYEVVKDSELEQKALQNQQDAIRQTAQGEIDQLQVYADFLRDNANSKQK